MFQLIRTDLNFDFLGKSKPFVWASTIAGILSLVALFKPGLNFGIDFTGGAEIQLQAPQGWDIGKLRSELEGGGVKDPLVVQLGEPAERHYLVKMRSTSEELTRASKKVEDVLTAKDPGKTFQVLKAEVVGPAAGERLREGAFLSVLYALICIVVYITMRFDVRYAPGVLRALLVDVVITLGIWAVFQWEFNLTVLASFLTIAGYSCNDTIVIYDRIRDYSKDHPTWSLEQAINKSINLNLGRTFITTGATLFVVVAMFALGGPVLRDFALPMLIGFSISVPSTIFVANPMILYMEKRRLAKEGKASPGKGSGKPARNGKAGQAHPAETRS